MSTLPDDGEIGIINWPDEAAAVISDIKKHVHQISISTILPATESAIYLNCETIEFKKFTIRLSSAGFQIVGNDFNTITDTVGFPYETPYALLGNISPGYISSFGNELSKALENLSENNQSN